jgi:DNA-binding winged helix-turn-helix (wHTH) protein
MPRLRVGDWLLDPAMNQISRGAKVERLEPKAVEVLVALAQRAGDAKRCYRRSGKALR